MKKILILAIYAAPYRSEVFKTISNDYDTTVFYEMHQGDERNAKYFSNDQNAHYLDTKDGLECFRDSQKRLRQYDAVALYDWSSKYGCALMALCRMKRIPYFVNCDGVILQKHGNGINEIIKKMLLKGASAYLVSGQHAVDYFLRYGAKEERIHIHGFTTLHETDILDYPIGDIEKRKYREKLNLPVDAKIAIAVGRFVELKRYDVLIRLWKEMRDDKYLLLIGGGTEERRYRQIIEELCLKNVLIYGYCDKEELKMFYRSADVFLHPTSYDAWGLVINEAMANGVPVIASDRSVAALELIDSGNNGFVLPLDDNRRWINSIEQILGDKALAQTVALAGLETIRPFTIENMAGSHKDVFKSFFETGKAMSDGRNYNQCR